MVIYTYTMTTSELLHDRYDTEKMTVTELKELIWRYYMSYWNNRRICSANDGLPPMVKRQQYYSSLQEAAQGCKSLRKICQPLLTTSVFPTSQYSVMIAKDFQTIDNLRLQSVIDDFKRIEPQQCTADQGNLVMLELLKAYDTTQNLDFLEAAKQMFSGLKQYNTSKKRL